MKRKSLLLAGFLLYLAFFPSLVLGDPARDPFYTEGESLATPPINTVREYVDPFSGVLTLMYTDVHLPGDGGLDINLIRTYNSMIWGRRDVMPPGLVAKNERSPLGIGWTMHMGIVHNPAGTGSNNRYLPDNPVVEMPDGSKHVFFKDKNDSTRFISKEFWVYKLISGSSGSGTWELTLTDGTVYTFEYGTTNAGYNVTDDFNTIIDKVGQVTKIRNAANTSTITIAYYKHTNGLSYLKTITDSVSPANRTITLDYDYTANRLTTVTVDSRTFTYAYTTINGNNHLSSVTPPTGNAWTYGYETGTNTYELNSITYPFGGRIAYIYSDVSFATGVATATVPFRVVTGKTTYKRGGATDGTWSYSYSAPTSGNNVTTVTAPDVTETHTFYGWGNTGMNNVWKVGLPMSKSYSGNYTLSESYAWTQGTQISNDQLANANWSGTGGQVYDSYIYVPFLGNKTITRDGKTYSTTYSSINTYGDPQSISESGDSGGATRSRTLSYWTNTTTNMVKGKPSSESVTGSPFTGSASTSWTYDSNSGNVTNITKDGVSTTYGYDTKGNLSSVTDANNHAITYLWSYGRISRETNSYYNISRTINPNGTIADETDGRGGSSYKTTFSYDGLLRPTGKTPPIANPTTISYPNADGSIKRVTRGGYTTDYTFDGFGRPSGSSDSKGITTTIAYSPYGPKDYEDTNIGDKVFYDYFGRVKQVLHKDNTSITYVYSTTSTNKTTITDEKPRNTELTYKAFGNPDEKYLMSVYDAAGKTTTYTRNIQGNLTGVTQGSITRSFGYDGTKKNFLTSETNQETGTISYGRDNVGNMTSKTDSSGTTTYGYDNINRLTSITVTGNPAGNVVSFGYDNANNRTSMNYPGGSATFYFDALNRMYQKRETVSGRTYTTGFGFDNNDNLQTITYPSGRIVTYGYNTKNEITSITGFGGSVTSVQHYTTGTYLGMLQSYALSNGITTSLSYNTRNLTTAITAGSALSIGYGYTDPRGNATSYTNSLDASKNQTFGYDDLNRLSSFSGAWGSGSFGYDDTGNRSTKTVGGSSTTYSYSNNRVSSTSGQEVGSYSYSAEGQLSGGTWDGVSHTLNYDKFDNLLSVVAGSTTVASFTYDGDNQRVSKTANGNKTIYHYDLGGRVLSEDDGSGNLIADYVFLEGKLIAKVATVPNISASPTSNNFGSGYVNTTSAPQTITITNSSSQLLIGTVTLSGASMADFVKTADACSGQILDANVSCTVQVAFSPKSVGAKSASLNIPSNAPNSPLTVTLSGNGVNPLLTVTRTGTGDGTITSTPTGLTCGSTCSASFAIGTSVTLQAVSDSDSAFTGWSGGGCSGTGTCTVTMNADTTVTPTFSLLPPTADFSGTPTSGLVPLSVNFADHSVRANAWIWTFGDNAPTSNLQNPSHTYTQAGTYSVTLQTLGVSGNSTVTKNNYITVWNPVTLTVSNSGTGGGTVTSTPEGMPCDASCVGLYAPGTLITLLAEPDANSSFAGWSGEGCSGTEPCTITLNADTTVSPTFLLLPPAADFTATPSAGVPSLAVSFTDMSLRADSWLWDFGDGTTSTLQNPSHTYTQSGTYSVTLTATNSVSGSNSLTKNNLISITDAPLLTIIKTGTGAGTVTSTPGGIACGASCSTFFALGTTVTLQATPVADSTFTGWSGGGCSGTGICTITLDTYANITADFTMIWPVAGYSAFPTTGVAPFTVDFTDASLRADSWSWNFGDGTTSSLQSPSHTYTQPGIYSVTMQASNASGSATVTKSNLVTITVTPVNGVQIPGSPPASYTTLQAALDAAQDSQAIQSQAVGFTEDLNLVNPVAVSLTGGYNGNFTTNTETTVVTGSLTITDGSLTVDKLAIR